MPELLLHERHVGGIEQRPGEHQHRRPVPAQGAAHVVEGRDERDVEPARLEGGVQAHRRLDVGEQDRDPAERRAAGRAAALRPRAGGARLGQAHALPARL